MHARELFDLSGRVAIVTGGGTGIGLQMATALAEMGADVVLCARAADRCEAAAAGLRKLGVRAIGMGCDVADGESVAAMVQRTREELGRVDVLVNNAGRAWVSPATEMDVRDWQRVIDVNLTGAFVCAQAVGRVMIDQGDGGRIVNVASILGLGGVSPEILDSIAYSASKAGLIGLTRDLACKWASHGITVNAIAPGWFPTRLSGAITDRWRERLERSIPLGRLGGPDDLKGAVVYLASRASAYVTGQVLVVDGGGSVW